MCLDFGKIPIPSISVCESSNDCDDSSVCEAGTCELKRCPAASFSHQAELVLVSQTEAQLICDKDHVVKAGGRCTKSLDLICSASTGGWPEWQGAIAADVQQEECLEGIRVKYAGIKEEIQACFLLQGVRKTASARRESLAIWRTASASRGPAPPS